VVVCKKNGSTSKIYKVLNVVWFKKKNWGGG